MSRRSEVVLAKAILDGSARVADIQALAKLVLAREEPTRVRTGDTGVFEHWADCPRRADGRRRCTCSEKGLEEDVAEQEELRERRLRLAAEGRPPGPTLSCNVCSHAIEGVGGAWPEMVRLKKHNVCVECGGKVARV